VSQKDLRALNELGLGSPQKVWQQHRGEQRQQDLPGRVEAAELRRLALEVVSALPEPVPGYREVKVSELRATAGHSLPRLDVINLTLCLDDLALSLEVINLTLCLDVINLCLDVINLCLDVINLNCVSISLSCLCVTPEHSPVTLLAAVLTPGRAPDLLNGSAGAAKAVVRSSSRGGGRVPVAAAPVLAEYGARKGNLERS
jgi:hypothetical protein